MELNREDILRMAHECGATKLTFDRWVLETSELERFANLVAAAEREAMVKKDLTIDSAYKERNQLVALLSTCFPAGKAKTAIEGWDEAWHGCVYIDFPWGQASWHYHERDEWMFEHLPPYQKQWDGHTTEQKYSAIAKAIRARGHSTVKERLTIPHEAQTKAEKIAYCAGWWAAMAAKAKEQSEQEPVKHKLISWGFCGMCGHDKIPGESCARNDCPEKGREWQGLTEEEIWKLYYDERVPDGERCDRVDFARAIEGALKEKNYE